MNSISIIGATITGNRGAEAMLTTTIGRIRQHVPDAVFHVYTYYPAEDLRVLRDQQIRIHSASPLAVLCVLTPLSCVLRCLNAIHLKGFRKFFPKSIQGLAESDVLIDLAGVSFIDGREKFLPYNILTIFPAMALGVPVVKFAQAVGPFNHWLNRICSRIFLNACHRIHARGDKTFEYLEDLHIAENTFERSSDVAFLHKMEDALSQENPEHMQTLLEKLRRLHTQPGRLLVGICPSAVIAGKAQSMGWDYIAFLHDIVVGCFDKGYHVLLFSNSTREYYPHRRKNNDLPYVLEVVERVQQSHPHYVDRLVYMSHDLNTNGIKALIAECDLTVVSRFHAMVASLSTLTPTLVLGWSHKYREVMKQFEQEQWMFDYTVHDPHVLLETLDDFVNQLDESVNRITQHFEEVKHVASRQIQMVIRDLKDAPGL